MDALICERDPTMDARIVHSVSVSNKKEQSTLRHKERSLKSAKNVQEHIHRREEKELMRQLTKLQDEKGRRHPDILDSRSQSRSRTHSRVCGSAQDNDIHQILQLDQQSGRPSGGIAGPGHHAPEVSTHQTALNHRRSSYIMKGGLVNGGLFTGSGGGPGMGSSRHTNVGMSAQISNLALELNQGPPPVHQPAGYGHTIKEYVEREGLNKKRPAHSYMEPKGSHRRSSINGTVEEMLKAYQTTQSRSSDSSSLLDNTSSRLALNAALAQQRDERSSIHNLNMRQSLHRASGSIHRVPGPSAHRMTMPSDRLLLKGLFGGQSVLEVPDTEIDQQQKSDTHGAHHSDSDEDSSIESKSEKILHVTLASNDHNGTDNESNARVHFKDEEPKQSAVSKGPLQKDKLGVSDHIVATRKGSLNREKQTSNKSERKSSQINDKSSSKSSKKAISKSSHVVKMGSTRQKPSRESKLDKAKEDAETTSSAKVGPGSKSGVGTLNRIQIPVDALYELRTALGNTLQGESGGVDDALLILGAGQPGSSNSGPSCAYDPSSNSMQNRRLRARLRALQVVNSQLEALKQKKSSNPVTNFDPLEVLRCRYLRLSQSNIDTLTSLCRDAGVEVGLHPHMTIDDIGKYVFESDKLVSENSSSTGADAKHVIV